MCDSEFAAAQIEWQIVRLGSSMTFDNVIPAEPHYAPFVAAGFFFVQVHTLLMHSVFTPIYDIYITSY
jgi:hypothetical protein